MEISDTVYTRKRISRSRDHAERTPPLSEMDFCSAAGIFLPENFLVYDSPILVRDTKPGSESLPVCFFVRCEKIQKSALLVERDCGSLEFRWSRSLDSQLFSIYIKFSLTFLNSEILQFLSLWYALLPREQTKSIPQICYNIRDTINMCIANSEGNIFGVLIGITLDHVTLLNACEHEAAFGIHNISRFSI